MDRQEIEALRLQVLANGYAPIRNVDKRTFMPAWPSVTVDEAEIRSWSRKHSRHAATGLRIENGLVAVDFDIDDADAMAAIAAAVTEAHPGLEQTLLRWGKGAKEAWFCRCDELFTRLHTRAFLKPGTAADDGTFRVEIFGGGSPRQFGAFGAHTKDERTGETLVAYEWADDLSPATVPFADLPVFEKAVFWDIVDISERVLLGLGWLIHEKSTKGESASGKVYDITEDMIFECNDEVDRTLDELRAAAAAEDGHLRCSASWLEGSSAKRRDRCLVSLARSGHVAIWESMEGVTHLEKADEPIDYGPMIDRVAEKLTELKEKRRIKVTQADEFESATTKIVKGFAYCASRKLPVVPLYASSLDEGLQLQAFRVQMMPYTKEEKGPRGGSKKINPVDVWASVKERIDIEGLRMRPDQPRPLFTEDGRQYVNVYSPPDHREVGGDIKPGIKFLEHLIPDVVEREWFTRWLSFKLRYPHIPGPAVVMVAHATFGTGRGTLAELVSRLFGRQYVRQLDFKDFTGKTYQSQYNDWQGEALVVCVNESAETDSGGSYQTKLNTYEHLKSMVEVRPTVRNIKLKGDRNFWALSSTSFLIFTNHSDALPIPEHDRRFGMVTNGGTKPVSYWNALNAWMDVSANVSAMFHWLINYELEDYSPFAKPPTFDAKANMIDEAKSDLDRAIEMALVNMPGEVFTMQQLEKVVKQAAEQYGMELPRPFEGVFRKVARKMLKRVGVRDGKNWHLVEAKQRHPVYARNHAIASRWTDEEMPDLVHEASKNGALDGGGSNVLAAFFNKHRPES